MKSEQLTYECVKYTQVVGFFFSPFRFFGKRMIQFFWRLFYPVKWNRPDQLPDLTDLLQTDTEGGGTNRLIDSQTNMQAYRKRGRQYHGGLCYKYTELWIDKVQVSQRRVRIVDWMWLTARSQHAGVSTLHVCQIMAACVCLCVKH